LTQACPDDLINQLSSASRRLPIWPFVAVALAIIACALQTPGLILLIPGIPAVIWIAYWDQGRRKVIAFYDVSDEPAQHFSDVGTAISYLMQAQRIWLVQTAAHVSTTHQYKVNSGASRVVQRVAGAASMSGPPHLVTNVAVPSVSAGRHGLYFLPDRILVRSGKAYTTAPYSSLYAFAESQRFIEEGAVPGDSQQVDSTWRYVNVKGGPDRRFNNNRQLPIMLYGRLTLASNQVFHLVFDVSWAAVASTVATALQRAQQGAIS
jgi:DNA polymerase-3 subunit epsilon